MERVGEENCLLIIERHRWTLYVEEERIIYKECSKFSDVFSFEIHSEDFNLTDARRLSDDYNIPVYLHSVNFFATKEN